mgnify:CR=1 FL=1
MAKSIKDALREANQKPVVEEANAGATPDAEIDRITTDDDSTKTPLDNATDITVLGGAIKLQNIAMAQLQERVVALETFLQEMVGGEGASVADAEEEPVAGTEPIE